MQTSSAYPSSSRALSDEQVLSTKQDECWTGYHSIYRYTCSSFRDYDPHARVLYTIPQTPPNVIMMPV